MIPDVVMLGAEDGPESVSLLQVAQPSAKDGDGGSGGEGPSQEESFAADTDQIDIDAPNVRKYREAAETPKMTDQDDENNEAEKPAHGPSEDTLKKFIDDSVQHERDNEAEDAPKAPALQQGELQVSSKPEALPLENAEQSEDADAQKKLAQKEKKAALNAAVNTKVERSLEKSLQAKDDQLMHVSKAELNREIKRETAGFDAKQDMEAAMAPQAAKEQAHDDGDNKHEELMAKIQAGGKPVPDVDKLIENHDHVVSKIDDHLLSVRQHQLGKDLEKLVPSTADLVKQDEKSLAKGDEELMHVSKKELNDEVSKMMAKMSATTKNLNGHTQAESVSSELDEMRNAIEHAQPVDETQDGNPFHMTNDGRKLVVANPVMQGLTQSQAHTADVQAKFMKLNPAEQAWAKYQDNSKMFVPTKARLDAAYAQAKGMKPLRGAAKLAAQAQAKGLNLRKADEEDADVQAAGPILSAQEKVAAMKQMNMPPLTAMQARAASEQSRMPTLNAQQQRAAAQQASTKLFSINHDQAVAAWRQSQEPDMTQTDMKEATEQSAAITVSPKDRQRASMQAQMEQLTDAEKADAESQTQLPAPSQQEMAAAASDAEENPLSNAEREEAEAQSNVRRLTPTQQQLAMNQATQQLRPMDAASAMQQAFEKPLSPNDQQESASQAQGMQYSKVRKQAEGQVNSKLFKPNVEDEVFAFKQGQGIQLKNQEQQAAAQQAVATKLKPWEAAEAQMQAASPQMTKASTLEANKLAAQPEYHGDTKNMAVKQAQLDLLTGKITAQASHEAEEQASEQQNPRDMKKALEQAMGPTLSHKDMQFAVTQAKKMYGMSKKQAVDTVTKLTEEMRLQALRQADDSLKRRDAARAKKQAEEVKLTLQDEWDAAHQAHDNELEKLSQENAAYAQKQTDGEFAGQMTAENAKIARDLTTKALKKREKFLSGFEEWQEKRREAKLRLKFAKEREALLGESASVAPNKQKKVTIRPHQKHGTDLGESGSVSAAQPSGPLALDEFHKKLEAIRNAAKADIDDIHVTTNKAMGVRKLLSSDIAMLDSEVMHAPGETKIEEDEVQLEYAKKVVNQTEGIDVADAAKLKTDEQNDAKPLFPAGSSEADTAAVQAKLVSSSAADAKASEDAISVAEHAVADINSTASGPVNTSTPGPHGNNLTDAQNQGMHADCKECLKRCKTDTCRSWCNEKMCSGDRANQNAKKAAANEVAAKKDMQKVKDNQAKLDQESQERLQKKLGMPNNSAVNQTHIVKVYEHKTIQIIHPAQSNQQAPTSDARVDASAAKRSLHVEVTALPKLDRAMPEDASTVALMHDAELRANEMVRLADKYPNNEEYLHKAEKALSAVETLRTKDLQYFHNHLKQRAEIEHNIKMWKNKPAQPHAHDEDHAEENKTLEQRVAKLESDHVKWANVTHSQHPANPTHSSQQTPERAPRSSEDLAAQKKEMDEKLIEKVNRLSKKAKKLNLNGEPVNYAEAKQEILNSKAKEVQYKGREQSSVEKDFANRQENKNYADRIKKIDQRWIDFQLASGQHPDPSSPTSVSDDDKEEDARMPISNTEAHLDALEEKDRKIEHEDAERALHQLMRSGQAVAKHAAHAQLDAKQAHAAMRDSMKALGLHQTIVGHPRKPDDDHPDAPHSTDLAAETNSTANSTKGLSPTAIMNKRKQILVSAKARADEAVQKAQIRQEADKLIQSHEKEMKKVEEDADGKAADAQVVKKQKIEQAKAAGSAAMEKAQQELEKIKQEGANNKAVQAAEKEDEAGVTGNSTEGNGTVATTGNSTGAQKDTNATAVAANKVIAKAKAVEKEAVDKAEAEAQIVEDEHEDSKQHLKRSDELKVKSAEKVNETLAMKRETVAKFHSVEQKLGVRADPRTITNAVQDLPGSNASDTSDSTTNSSAHQTEEEKTEAAAAQVGNMSSTDKSGGEFGKPPKKLDDQPEVPTPVEAPAESQAAEQAQKEAQVALNSPGGQQLASETTLVDRVLSLWR